MIVFQVNILQISFLRLRCDRHNSSPNLWAVKWLQCVKYYVTFENNIFRMHLSYGHWMLRGCPLSSQNGSVWGNSRKVDKPLTFLEEDPFSSVVGKLRRMLSHRTLYAVWWKGLSMENLLLSGIRFYFLSWVKGMRGGIVYHYVAQTGLKLTVFLPQPPKC